jgi:hypothetical protein
MAELKTKPTGISVESFIKKIPEAEKQKDCFTLVKLMEKATKAKAKMWGPAIIGFGDTHLKYESGRELDWFVMGFSPRKASLSLYLCGSIQSKAPLLKKLGKHKTSKGCLYINKLEDVDMEVLKELIEVNAGVK